MNIDIRPMKESDLSEVVDLENHWTYLSKWGGDGYRTVLRNSRIYTCLVAEDRRASHPNQNRIAGMAVLARMVDHAELCNIVVSPTHLGTTTGQRLLDRCLEVAESCQVEEVFLEVRSSNHRAIHFYEKNGFQIVSERKDYYQNPRENAWVMRRPLLKAGAV